MLRKPASGWPFASLTLSASLSSHERALTIWLDALVDWNAKMDLTAAKDAEALTWLMLADASNLARVAPTGASLVDVGTGAGAPGLALAILRPDLKVTLVEPLGKRAAFLRSVIGTLGRTDVTLLAKDASTLSPGAFDIAVSRATFPPGAWLTLGATLVRAGGSVWLFLAREEPPVSAVAERVETIEYSDRAAIKRLVRYVRA